jgi:putative GTP pyrophosphokinase
VRTQRNGTKRSEIAGEESTQTKLLEEYERKHHAYATLESSVRRLLDELLKAADLRVLSISGRVKEKESLQEKIGRPDRKYKKLHEITDIVGLRIVTFFEDDVDKVATILEKEFCPIREHCVDRRAYSEPDKFGYRSLHYVCNLTRARKALTENANFKSEPFEIQVRSILQHAWAEIEHDLGYKSAVTIPNEIKRQLSRVSGLLEIADREFREIRDQSLDYRRRVSEELKRNQRSTLNLDSITFSEFLSSSNDVKQLDDFIRKELGYQIKPDSETRITLEMLQSVGIRTVEDLRNALTENMECLKALAREFLTDHFEENKDRWVHAGLSVFHLPQVLAARKGIDELAHLYDEHRIGGSLDTSKENAAELIEFLDRPHAQTAKKKLPKSRPST